MNHFWLWHGAPLLLVVLIAGCGSSSNTPPVSAPETVPAQGSCGDGLAAEDLSGQCRAKPQATMGALEAVS